MPLTITVSEIAAAVRLTADPTQPPEEPYLGILTREWEVARDRIDGYAPDAPQTTKNEAAVRAIGYLLDGSNTALNNAPQVDSFRLSGAMALLAPYRVHVGGVTPSGSGELIIVPSHPVHPGTHNRYLGWTGVTTIGMGDFATAAVFMADVLTIPARTTNGYLWFGVDNAVGYPGSLVLGQNPTNQLPFYMEQLGTVEFNGVMYVVGLNPNLLNPTTLVGENITLGYRP